MPVRMDSEKAAPMLRPSMKLCTPSPKMIIQATVAMGDWLCSKERDTCGVQWKNTDKWIAGQVDQALSKWVRFAGTNRGGVAELPCVLISKLCVKMDQSDSSQSVVQNRKRYIVVNI